MKRRLFGTLVTLHSVGGSGQVVSGSKVPNSSPLTFLIQGCSVEVSPKEFSLTDFQRTFFFNLNCNSPHTAIAALPAKRTLTLFAVDSTGPNETTGSWLGH